MSEKERQLHRRDVAELYVATARRYKQSAIFFHPPEGVHEEDVAIMLELIREISGMDYFLMLYCDPTFGIPNGAGMEEFSFRIVDEPDKLKAQVQEWLNGEWSGSPDGPNARPCATGWACAAITASIAARSSRRPCSRSS